MAEACSAFDETVVFPKHFKDVRGSRQRGKVTYPRHEILFLCLTVVLARAESVIAIGLIGANRLELLRRFDAFKDSTPAQDHLVDILTPPDAGQFECRFTAWVTSESGVAEGRFPIDGKTVRWAHNRSKAQLPSMWSRRLPRASALCSAKSRWQGGKVARKSNEIVASTKLLDMLAIEGAIVTIDAIGWQRAIAQRILEEKDDYVLALKGNQSSPHDDAKRFVVEQKVRDFKETKFIRGGAVDSGARRNMLPGGITRAA